MHAKTLAPLVLTILLLGAHAVTFSQPGNAPLPPADTALGQLLPVNSTTPSTPAMEAERAKIWNSPNMLRARAWAQEYIHASAQITPEEAKDYMVELRRMNPTQMKLWLMKFDHEQQMMHQRQAAFEASRQASVKQAMAIDHSIRQSYGRINQADTEAAQEEQNSLNEQEKSAQQSELNKQDELNTPDNLGLDDWYDNYGYGAGPFGYGPLGGGYLPPVYHYHFHY